MKRTLHILSILLKLAVLGTFVAVVSILVTYQVLKSDLPDVSVLRDVQLQVPLRIYTRDGKLIQTYGEKQRAPVPIDQIPDRVKQAFIAGEDARFYDHPGIDYQGITRAVWHIIKTGGDKGPGGSTITQQLARDFGFVSKKRSYLRKVKEWFLAIKIEQELSKDEILNLFLNKTYLGNRAYGVAMAARNYYGKDLNQLTVAEAAMLASLPKAPSRITPIISPERAMQRRNYVLGQMHSEGYIDQATYQAALTEPDRAFRHKPKLEANAAYAAEQARQQIVSLLGAEEAYTGGYQAYTTIDSTLQAAANSAVISGLKAYDRRHGYRGPDDQIKFDELGTLEDRQSVLQQYRPIAGIQPALVTDVQDNMATVYMADGREVILSFDDMSWAKPYINPDRVGDAPAQITDIMQPGDVIRVELNALGTWVLSQVPIVEGALISMNPQNGGIFAMVGGFDFERSKFNRATQAKRQPGSNFKPFIYAAALNRGLTPATVLNDSAVVFDDNTLERTWKPENYSRKFFGPTRLREGIVHSRNLISIRTLERAGLNYSREFVLKFGFNESDIPNDLSMALGTGVVQPISVATAYAVFANGGYLTESFLLDYIVDSQGNVVFQTAPKVACLDCQTSSLSSDADNPDAPQLSFERQTQAEITPSQAPQIISSETAYLVDSMLRDAVRRGTGTKALALGRKDLAGKTGTTNDQRDAWFSGYNHHMVTTTWVGFDQSLKLGRGEVGGVAALPMWIDYMRIALEDVNEVKREIPDRIVFARINPETGLICGPSSQGCIDEIFNRASLPETELAVAENGEQVNPYEIY